ncbi:PREDICTED: adaptin ear-binding coat-associated protein 1-like [Branchiostoma belcheri]|uniref:Adaptin ear-binding coat-associated protein 1-like n=1 Tax=Branchiostoma belcheri TaxID=7741 RepID=A0A6P4YFY7_BRABE|nr:PREDICTED: adaptin ear-binding coat-associated protein 1-like [Branchiostoma belcheri]
MMADYESIVCVKPEVFVYRIPPRPSNRGYRAADWKLDAPDYTGRMRIVAKGKNCVIKIEDKNSGELFAQAPVDAYPGVAVESVTDSSRYFVIRVQDDSGRSAFIGMGFGDRGDSFDFNVALQDHFKWVRKSEQIEKEGTTDTGPKLDLGFKEGQTITINIGKKKSGSKAKPSGGAGGFLPPPPGGKIPTLTPPPGGAAPPPQQPQSATGKSNVNSLLDLDPFASSSNASSSGADWGDFAGAGSGNSNQSGSSWVQF